MDWEADHRDVYIIVIKFGEMFKKSKRRCTSGQHQEIKDDTSWTTYILLEHQLRKGTKNLQTMSGADVISVHNLLVAKMCTSWKKIMMFQKDKPVWVPGN
jgi:hypothetical protein